MMAVLVAMALEGSAAPGHGPNPFESPAQPVPQTRIDELVFGRLEKLGIQPAPVCSDAVFVRRVYLDVIGTLPTAQEAQGVPPGPRPEQAPRADRPPAGAGGVCRLLGDEVERPAAGQGGVPHQPLAQRGPGLSPLDSHQHQGEQALRPVRPASCSPPAAATSASPPVNFYRAMQSREPQGIAQTVALTFMGARAEKWPTRPAGRHGGLLLAGRLQVHRASGRRRSSSSIRARPPTACAGGGGLPGWHAGPALAGPGPARGLRRLADRPEESLVRAATSSTASGPGCWGAASSTSRTTSGRTIRRQSRAAGLAGAGAGRPPLRPEAPLPADPELEDLPAFLRSRRRPARRARPISRYYPLRRLEAEVLIDALCQITGTTEKYSSADPGAVHLHSRGPALDRAAGRQHHQFLPGDVRPAAARHGPGVGAQQPPHGRPAAAPAEFEPHPAQDRAEPDDPDPAAVPARPPREIATGMYLAILSRFPTEDGAEDRGGAMSRPASWPGARRRWTWPGR